MKSRYNVFLFILVIFIISLTLVYLNIRNKFQDVTIELGTEKVDLEQFLVSNIYLKRSKFLTDINSVNFSEVGEYPVELSFGEEKQTVKLKVVDTKAPKVDFTDLEVGLDYVYNKDDFVVLVKDASEYTITSNVENLETKLGEYPIKITVTDAYGNKTEKVCNLTIGVFHKEITHELGDTLSKEEIVISKAYGLDSISNADLAMVDATKSGEYKLNLTYEDKTYETKVIVKDTKGPDIDAHDIISYLGYSKAKTKEDFVDNITDPSGVVDVTYEGELDFNTLGVQELKITAKDNLGNVSEKVVYLTVKNDDVGPVISGLTDITINKGETIDYLAGVKAVDAKDGQMEVTVDSSAVNTSAFGTYYAIYTSKDLSNNVTTKKRKIFVNYDSTDVDNMYLEYYNKNLKGKSVLQIVKYIRNHISYVHNRGSDPIYIALTQKKGSCYGHAMMVKKALDIEGIPNYLVETTDGTHYWNLVFVDGVWRHYDSTPGKHDIGPDTDAQKLASVGLGGRKWDKSLYPAAT